MNRRIATALVATSILAINSTHASEMQAAVVAAGNLVVQSRPIPQPTAKDVRIKVHAAGVNPADWGFFGGRAGATPGFDVSGIIDSVGADVTGWKQGDAVIAMAPNGGYAQYVVAPVSRLAKKPAKLSFDEAAGIPVVGETAYRSLVEVAKLQKGQRILIHGGAGGVGSAAVQIARSLGAHVIATGSARNHEFMRSIGADEVIDYTSVKFEEKVSNLDVVLNTADAGTGMRSLGILKPDGILVSVVPAPSAEACAAAKVRCARPDRNSGPSVNELLTKVGELADAGRYVVNVDQRFTLAEATQAWDQGKKKHTRGKLIITIPQ